MKSFFKVLLVYFLFAALPARAEEPIYNIENVTGDLYRFQSNNHYGVFLVTDEGIILADPINTATATWLKGELWSRFEKEVKLVIYSHHHKEHISGGEVFAETALFAAHENAVPEIEKGGYAVLPDLTFSQTTAYEIGGQKVELYYFGPSHTDNLVSIYFPEQKALFLVDAVAIKSFPYHDMLSPWLRTVFNTLNQLDRYLDINYLIPGHGKIGKKKDLMAYLFFIQDLGDGVSKAIVEGKTVEEAKQKIGLGKYRKWEHFNDWKGPTIESMYREILEYDGDFLPLVKENPRYPRVALANNICGFVLVEYDVTEKGETENIRITDSQPPGVFDRSAVKAAEKYIYRADKRVEGVQTRITFEIKGKCIMPPFSQKQDAK